MAMVTVLTVVSIFSHVRTLLQQLQQLQALLLNYQPYISSHAVGARVSWWLCSALLDLH